MLNAAQSSLLRLQLKSHKLSINLLPQDPFYETPLGRVMNWASTIGRYLVIFTELIVILSFGARFTLDRTLTDLNGAILQKNAIVESYGSLEDEVRLVQKKTEYLSQQRQLPNTLTTLDLLSKNLPRNVSLDLLQSHGQEVQIAGIATTPESLALLVRILQSNPSVAALFVDQIKSSVQGKAGLEFSMRVLLSGVQQKT